ncbi:MAG: tRNA (adenosine(37)-N6)-threonylcarbamoyltransferase complex ATPase subunit type 1 TsaE, partial [Luminiphilus sp.]|nr:tRNA (adenosine(37)-N6)-threonylcarbamoyltransferase complex ATPase subunit type 1 TsaE [Luminiphilus sp.]
MEKPSELSIDLPDEASTVDLGRQLGGVLPRSGIVFLSGELGAGKTTLVRGVLHSLGHVGAVKSPTYTLCEPYVVSDDFLICHFDLYRLGQAEELEFLGFRDYVSSGALLLIEW